MEPSGVRMNKQNNTEMPYINFEQAMEDFRTMFPKIDQDVIEEVLRANNGAVDPTIDQLLTMTTDNMNEALRVDLEKSEEETHRKCDSKNKSLSEWSNIATGFNTNKEPLKVKQKWFPPLLGALPPTFLRIEPVDEDEKSLPECGEDERIALFLQNEEFLSELRTNQDFMSTLEENSEEGRTALPDLETLKARLRNMGKRPKKKFCQLSRVFQRHRKARSAKGILDQSASGDSMLLSGEPLLSENFDDTVHKD